MYDNNSDIFGFIYNDTEYYYIKNAQNDVIAIADKDGKIALKYSYDAWGKVISITNRNGNDINNLRTEKFDPTTGETITEYDENGNVIEHIPTPVILARINPILYRSYYYDKETEWYYLNTRYYSPDMCRFINADDSDILFEDQDNMLENNLFAYCLNNPVVMFDEDGQAAANIIGAIVGGAVGAGLGYLLAKHFGLTGWKKAAVIAAAAVGGAALGALLGPYVAKLGGKVAAKLGIKAVTKQTAKVGNGTNWKTLSEIQYNNSGLMSKQTYGNGDYVDFSYDNLDRQTEKKYNNDSSKRIAYSYGNNGSVAQITDYFTNSNTRFTYDLADRVVSQREYSGTAKSGGELRSYTDFTYASKTNYLTGIKHFSPLGTQTIGYTFGVQKNGEMPDQIYKVTWNGAEKVKYTYDKLGRLESKHTGSFDTNFTYEDVTVNNDQRTTTLVKSVTTPTTYTYDKLGNILSVTDGTYTTSYEYDSLNQLTRVNDEKAGKTYTYSYTNGNITECNEYDYTLDELGEPLNTKTWEYNDSTWSDLLTNYNGTPITYDEIGNPLTIGEKTLTWTGRQLQSITDNENAISYTYNGDGLRTSKTVNGETTEYFYNGSILAGQKTGDNTLVFMYDNNSDIFGVIYNDVEYYYIKNAQNDVIAITDADGNVLVKYTYDAWGKVIKATDKDGNEITETTDESTNPSNDIDESVEVDAHIDPSNTAEPTTTDELVSLITVDPQTAQIANLNPILYRSYYYDKETEWYYLNTRYYSPDMCRFINADSVVSGTASCITGYNLFSYCFNNPLILDDSSGNWPKFVKNIANRITNAKNSLKAKITKKLTKKYDVPLYRQGKYNLCWAFTQTMVEDYRSGVSRTNDEATERAIQIAKSVHGEKNWNKGSRPQNRGRPLISNSCLAIYIALSISDGPIEASYGKYENGNRVSGHSIVITGVDVINGIVYTNNPWGIRGEQSHEEFIEVFAGGQTGQGWKLDNCYYLD